MANYDDDTTDTDAAEETEESEYTDTSDDAETTEEAEPEEEAIDWEARAKKAEATIIKAKTKPKPAVEAVTPSELTTKDLYALMQSKVPQSDISDVEEYAKFKGISVTEALNSSTVKTILAQKEEERRVAAGTNTGTSRRATSKVTDDQLMTRVTKGEMPESSDDIRRFNELRWGLKK